MNLDLKKRSTPFFVFGTIFVFAWAIFFISWCFIYDDPAETILLILWIISSLVSSLLFIVGAHENTVYKNNMEKWKIEENKRLKNQQFNQQIPDQFNSSFQESKKEKQEQFTKSPFEEFEEFDPNPGKINNKIVEEKGENPDKVDKEIIANCEKICNNHWKCMQECVTFSLKFKDNLNIEDYKYDEEKRN